MVRVAIIGAGPSGMSQMRAFQVAAQKGIEIPEVVCFEKLSDVGGIWTYSWRTGLDEYGDQVHSSMYRNLWSNGPKELLEFADYSFEEHFGKPISSYPTRPVLLDYLKGRLEKTNVRSWIRFNTPIRMVRFDEGSKKFTVTAHERDGITDRIYDEEFDYVVVATGHFSTPIAPHFEGLESFNGRVLHAHDFRDAAEFKGKDVLLVGSNYSAEDIASQCWKYGGKSMTVSYHTKPMEVKYKWPENFEQRPHLTKLVDKTAHFADGSSKDVDAVILCTGYKHYFPFLTDDLRLKTASRLWPDSLYKCIVFEGNHRLFYLGMQDQLYSFNMFDAQAWYVRDLILGRTSLPSKEEMQSHFDSWRARESKVDTLEDTICFQSDYMKEILSDSDYATFDTEDTKQLLMEWMRHKHQSIMEFRDNAYRSIMTGTMSPKHHTKWSAEMDDSIENFIKSREKGSDETGNHP